MENSNEKIIFKEQQYFHLINITFLILLIGLLFLFIFTKGYENFSVVGFSIIIILTILIPILLSYRMTTIVTKNKIIIKYGIGIIKKTIDKKKLNISNISSKKIPWYFGAGIRLLNDGIVYNASPGNSLKIETLKSKKYVYIGTKLENELMAAIMN